MISIIKLFCYLKINNKCYISKNKFSLYIYIYIYIFIYIYVHIYIYVNVYVCITLIRD